MSNDQIQINPQGEIVSRRATTAVGALLSATVLASGSAAAQPAPDDAGVATTSDVVLNEIGADLVAAGPFGSISGSFIEIRNTTQQALPVGGWKLSGCNTTGEFDIRTFPPLTQIPAEGYLLVAPDSYEAAFGPARDFGFDSAAGPLEQSGGGVKFTDPSMTVMDDVKWGSPHSDCSLFADAGVSPDDDNSLQRNTTPPPTWCALPPTPKADNGSC